MLIRLRYTGIATTSIPVTGIKRNHESIENESFNRSSKKKKKRKKEKCAKRGTEYSSLNENVQDSVHIPTPAAEDDLIDMEMDSVGEKRKD